MGALAIIGPLIFGQVLRRQATAARGIQCLDNVRRLQLAWAAYSDVNRGILLGSMAVPPEGDLRRIPWVTGTVDSSGEANRDNWDVANTVGRSPLVPYLPADSRIWKCPADESVVEKGGDLLPRVRSYSMSSVFDTGYWLPAFRFRTYARRSEIVDPARTFVFVDEHPDSLNDGAFAVQMVEPTATDGNIIDLPGSLHADAANFSFADGHAETRRWVGEAIRQPVTYRGDAFMNIRARDSLPDVKWLSDHSTVRRPL